MSRPGWAARPAALALAIFAAGATLGAAARTSRAPRGAAADTEMLSRSIAFFRDRLVSDPGDPELLARLMSRYGSRFQLRPDLRDLDSALALAIELRSREPDRARGAARAAGALLSLHRFEEAYREAAVAVAIQPNGETGNTALYDAALAYGRYGEARAALSRLRAGSPVRELGEARWLEVRGRNAEAAARLSRVCARLDNPAVRSQARAWCLTELAKLQHASGDMERAVRTVNGALRVEPDYFGALEVQADLAHARGDWRLARRLYRRVANGAHPDTYLRLAEAERALGRDRQAIAAEHRFLLVAREAGRERLEGRPLALYYLRSPLTRDTALAIARRDLARRPTAESYDLLAWAELLNGHAEEALGASDQAIALAAPSPTVEYHRGRILEALGDGPAAAGLLERATRDVTLLDPELRMTVPRTP